MNSNQDNIFNLENRLINFSVQIIKFASTIPNNFIGIHLANQIVRSGTSCTLNYSEAKGGESRRDFIHKINLVIKELRESLTNLKILSRCLNYKPEHPIFKIMKENNELIAIFIATVNTAKRNQKH